MATPGSYREFAVLAQQADMEEGQVPLVTLRDKNLSRGKKALLVLGAAGLAAAAVHLVRARVGAPGAGAGDVSGVQSKAGSRTMVEDGCWTIEDREACCRHTDGRPWDYKGQECVPAKPGMEFQNGRVCQPRCWVEGTCVWNFVEVNKEAVGACPGDEGAATESETEAEKNTSEESTAEEDKPSTSTTAEADKPSESTDAEEDEAEDGGEGDSADAAVNAAEDGGEGDSADEAEDAEDEVEEEVVEEKTLKERNCTQENFAYEPLSMRGDSNYTVENSPEDCQKRCVEFDGCMHFSFWTPLKHCYLEGVYAQRNGDRLGFVSGPKVCKDDLSNKVQTKLVNIGAQTFVRQVYGCMEVGKIYSPAIAGSQHNYGNTTARKANIMCQQRCADYEGCAYYTLYLPAKDCLLSHANATKLAVASSALAGPARCADLSP